MRCDGCGVGLGSGREEDGTDRTKKKTEGPRREGPADLDGSGIRPRDGRGADAPGDEIELHLRGGERARRREEGDDERERARRRSHYGRGRGRGGRRVDF
eukprot:31334-Pelagococcus_subviridis.AAC.8